jgi:hypothetical protein
MKWRKIQQQQKNQFIVFTNIGALTASLFMSQTFHWIDSGSFDDQEENRTHRYSY